MTSLNTPSIILASSSAYRKILLSRFALPFICHGPNIDENVQEGESAEQTALRLAIAKAQAVAEHYPHALIIGSDQVASLGNYRLGKPGTHEKAVQQLQQMRGQHMVFYTALCLYNSATQHTQSAVVVNTVTLRDYSDAEIERYLYAEKPYDCAGSAKTEGLGITLIAQMHGPDPTALIGLPLITLTTMLKNEGIVLP